MPYIPDTTGETTRDLSGHNLNLNWDIPGNTETPSTPAPETNVVFDPTTPDITNMLDFGIDFSSLSMPSMPSMPSLPSMDSISNPLSSLFSSIMDSTTTTIILDDSGNIITETDETFIIPDGEGDVVVLETQTLEIDTLMPGPSSTNDEAMMKELESMLKAMESGEGGNGMMLLGGAGLGPMMVGGDEEMLKIFEVEGKTAVATKGRYGFDGYDAIIAIAVQVMFFVAIWGVVMGIRNQMMRYRGHDSFIEVKESVVIEYPGAPYRDEEDDEDEMVEGDKSKRSAKGEIGTNEEKVCLNV